MSEQHNTSTGKSKAPTHFAYHIRKAGDESFWQKIGVAWSNQDSKGYSIQLDTIPLDGRVTLRIAEGK